jgi:hypothetical protein
LKSCNMEIPGKILRQMGFLRDQEGIMNRYLSEKGNWNEHLDNTKDFIAQSFTKQEIESVAILGSGWLLDVPIEKLITRFKHIYLVDIRHPRQIRRKFAALDHVELVEADLTGGAIEQVWEISRKSDGRRAKDLPDMLHLKPPLTGISPDAFVSVNLLNQLDIILTDFLRDRGWFRDESPDAFRSLLQSFHLEWILQRPGCLVSDISELCTGKDGIESSTPLLYTSLPEGFRFRRWNWEFDTRGTYRHGFQTRMEVSAVEWG